MKLAVLMDPLHQIKAYKDSTVAMIKSAQDMGWSCVYLTQNDLVCRDGHAFAKVSSITINDVTKTDWAVSKPIGEKPLTEFDIILMRKDPPFDMEYIYSTYALELAEKEGVLIAHKSNDPAW